MFLENLDNLKNALTEIENKLKWNLCQIKAEESYDQDMGASLTLAKERHKLLQERFEIMKLIKIKK